MSFRTYPYLPAARLEIRERQSYLIEFFFLLQKNGTRLMALRIFTANEDFGNDCLIT